MSTGATRPDATQIEASLLELLREVLSSPRLEYAERPSLLGDGVTARAYSLRLSGGGSAISGPLVCRLFVEDAAAMAADQTSVEEALHNTLCDLGFPTPRVLASGDARSGLGFPFAVMERATGSGLGSLLVAAIGAAAVLAALGVWLPLLLVLVAYWALMARLLTRLHALPGSEIRRRLELRGLSPQRLGLDELLERLRRRIQRAELASLVPAVEWLERNRPAEPEEVVACHGDFWMGNVMVSTRRILLLDWTEACVAHPELDLGWIRMQHYSRPPLRLPPPDAVVDRITALVRPVAWLVFGANYRVYQLFRPVNGERLRYYTALQCVKMLVSIFEARTERETGTLGSEALLLAWGSAQTVALLRRRIRRETGLDVGEP